MTRVLVVEDDPALGPRMVSGLLRHGFDAVLAADGVVGRQLMQDGGVDLVVLDLMLPGEDGFSLLERWQHRTRIPVIVLTARTGLDDRLRAFGLGASDYLPKPFFMEELVARIRARLGLGLARAASETVPFGRCVVDLKARRVNRDGSELALTSHEFNLLAVLARHPDRAFTRAQLAGRALPDAGERLDRTVDSHISRIRRKLGDDAAHLETVRNLGYRYAP